MCMESFYLARSPRAPEVAFDFAANHFLLRGESYPEDVSAFYGPLVTQLKQHLQTQKNANITFNFDIIYFNSSTAKVLLGLFDFLDTIAMQEGNQVTIYWQHRTEDEGMIEIGEEFAEDLQHAQFVLQAIES